MEGNAVNGSSASALPLHCTGALLGGGIEGEKTMQLRGQQREESCGEMCIAGVTTSSTHPSNRHILGHTYVY